MPCPWYQYGMCTSPKLSEPTDAVVSVPRCASNDAYKLCSYYAERGLTRKSSAEPQRGRIKVYAPIHALPPSLTIACPMGEVVTLESGLRVAFCKALDRALTKHEAELCSKHWQQCPYRPA